MTPASRRHDYVTERTTERTTERNDTTPGDSVSDESPVSSIADATPAELRILISRWNAWADEGLVPHQAKTQPVSAAVLKAWGKAQRNGELQEALARLDEIEAAIRGSPFCREGWFRLEKLVAGTNADGELILLKLIEGGYADQANRRRSNSLNTLKNWKPKDER